MKSSEELKNIVRDKYDQIARQEKAQNMSSCCGSGPSSQEVYNIMTDDYSKVKGYETEADLGLGCGLPTQFAHIQKGDTILDLGSGAGNDCFVARHETGPEGKVIGIDFTPSMIQKARKNSEKLGFNNVEFREGDIEDMPVSNNSIDVIVSNCVLNLVPNKSAVFSEMFRVLEDGGHFSISDIVLEGELPAKLKDAAEMYAGCVSGSILRDEYLALIKKAGFTHVTLQKEKKIHIPDDILANYLEPAEIREYQEGEMGIFSITVYAEKNPGQKEEKVLQGEKNVCCGPECC